MFILRDFEGELGFFKPTLVQGQRLLHLEQRFFLLFEYLSKFFLVFFGELVETAFLFLAVLGVLALLPHEGQFTKFDVRALLVVVSIEFLTGLLV